MACDSKTNVSVKVYTLDVYGRFQCADGSITSLDIEAELEEILLNISEEFSSKEYNVHTYDMDIKRDMDKHNMSGVVLTYKIESKSEISTKQDFISVSVAASKDGISVNSSYDAYMTVDDTVFAERHIAQILNSIPDTIDSKATVKQVTKMIYRSLEENPLLDTVRMSIVKDNTILQVVDSSGYERTTRIVLNPVI